MAVKKLHRRKIKNDTDAGKSQGKFTYFSGWRVSAALLIKASIIIVHHAFQLLPV